MGHFAGELSVLYSARNVADELVHCHNAGGGMAAAGEGAWVCVSFSNQILRFEMCHRCDNHRIHIVL